MNTCRASSLDLCTVFFFIIIFIKSQAASVCVASLMFLM